MMGWLNEAMASRKVVSILLQSPREAARNVLLNKFQMLNWQKCVLQIFYTDWHKIW